MSSTFPNLAGPVVSETTLENMGYKLDSNNLKPFTRIFYDSSGIFLEVERQLLPDGTREDLYLLPHQTVAQEVEPSLPF